MERFERTIDILVRAYKDDTLRHGNCTACAVGNIIRGCNGEVTCNWFYHMSKEVMGYDLGGLYNETTAIEEIESTGYSIKEIDKIERAFESSISQFDGLMKVVDVLISLEEKEYSVCDVQQVKERFVCS